MSEPRPHKPGGTLEMLQMAVPMMISNACETIMTVTDRWFLSQLGPEYMTAAMGGGITAFTSMTFFIGLIGYSNAMVAQNLGAQREEKCFNITFHAIIIALCAYPIIRLLVPVAHWYFDVSGINEDQLEPQHTYFNILMYWAIMPLIRISIANFFTGIGKTHIVMMASMVTLVANIAGNYVLIFGKLGFEPMGISGAAYGTVFGGITGTLMMVVLLLKSNYAKRFPLRKSLYFHLPTFKKLIRFGTPGGIEFFLNLLSFSLMISIFHGENLVTATAVTIVMNWDMVAFVPLIGVGIAVTSLVGRYVGANDYVTAQKAIFSGFKISLTYTGIIFILFVCIPQVLIEIFQPENNKTLFSEVVPIATTMLRIASLYVLVESIMVVFSGALRGAGDTLGAMVISVSIHWMLLPLLYICFKVIHLPATQTWGAMTLLFCCLSSLFYFRFRSGKWKTIKVLD